MSKIKILKVIDKLLNIIQLVRLSEYNNLLIEYREEIKINNNLSSTITRNEMKINELETLIKMMNKNEEN